MQKILLCYGIIQIGVCSLHAQTADYQQYMKTMNSIIPGTPEASTLIKAIDFPISLFTGTPDIKIPICSVQGKEMGLSIQLSYTAAGGIKTSEMAGKTGLGWLLSTGEITREVRGAPDEGGGSGMAAGLLNNPQRISYYQNIIQNAQQGQTARDAAGGRLDLEPDVFYFSFNGASGKFMYDESLPGFVCTELQPYKVNYNKVADAWTITTAAGAIYQFDKKVQTQTRPECNNSLSTATAANTTTSWKLSKAWNADRTDSISIEYDYNSYSYYTEGASVKYQEVPEPNTFGRLPMNCFNKNDISGWDKILKICSIRDTINFQYAAAIRQDLAGQNALEKIIYSNGNVAAKAIFKLEFDYYLRPYVVGIYTAQTNALNKKSLRLKSLTAYGNSESNAYPPQWNFFYNESFNLPARLSYAQDFWGYYNNNQEDETLAPKDVLSYSNGATFLVDGADRVTSPDKMSAGILTKIQFPTGGTTSFEYEPNEVTQPVQFAYTEMETVMIDTFVFKPFGQYFNNTTYAKSFTISQVADPAINYGNPNGGVYASIYVDPHQIQNPPLSGGNYYPGKIHFILSGLSGKVFTDNEPNWYLQNGDYTIEVGGAPDLNGPPYVPDPFVDDGSPGRGFNYSIHYNKIATNAQGYVNRKLAGLRVKSVVSTDSIGNTSLVKRYSYRDPVADTSYGIFVGNTYHANFDYLTRVFTPPSGGSNNSFCYTHTYLCRNGNCIMPTGNTGAAVVYPNVTEYTIEGNKSYKTTYNFSYILPVYNLNFPFTPPYFSESYHGKMLESTVFQTLTNNSFRAAQKKKNNYDFSPVTQFTNPGTGFARLINGFRVSYAGFTNDQGGCGFDRAIGNEYSNFISMARIAADTTITYDISNDNRSIVQWKDYKYGDYNQLPLIIRSGNSDGTFNVQKNYYAADKPDADAEISTPLSNQLTAANRVTFPLAAKQFRNTQQLNRQYTYAHLDGTKLLVDGMSQALFSNAPENEISVLAYDNNANPLTIGLRGGKYRKNIWNAQKQLPLATCVMGDQYATFQFTSFEYNDENNQNNGRTSAAAFAGSYAFNLQSSNWNFNFLVSGSAGTDVYVWATGTVSVNGAAMTSTGKVKGFWTLYKKHIGALSTMTLSGSGYIDNLLILPTGSQFQGNVYDIGNRITATVNDQIATGFYEYDAFGRLQNVKDEQGNIIKSTSYQYQGAQ